MISRPHVGPTARLLGIVVISCMSALTSPHAAEPGFRNVTIASSADALQSETLFRPETPKIFLRAELADVPAGAKMTCAWIAAQAEGAPQNYVIDTLDQTAGTILGMQINVLNCSLSKPTSGWPVGSYRVELLVNGQKTNEAPFEVRSASAPAQAPVAAPQRAAPQVAATSPAAPARQARQNFTLINRTGYDIQEVYVSPSKAETWGDDVLGDDELGDGDQQLIRFSRSERTCLWDLKVVYSEDESEAIWNEIDLCKVAKITIWYNSRTDTTSATFD